MIEGTAVLARSISLPKFREFEGAISLTLSHPERKFPVTLKAQVFLTHESPISTFSEETELEKQITYLTNIATLETSEEVNPFEVFDLRPLESRQVIVEVRERRTAPFLFATDEESPSEDLNPKARLTAFMLHRLSGKVWNFG
ncbi:MAG: hypothetical protein RMK94_09175 [Armatimonadota bacterium]|nr:hypothetical protein [Armatimonadota bacterium]